MSSRPTRTSSKGGYEKVYHAEVVPKENKNTSYYSINAAVAAVHKGDLIEETAIWGDVDGSGRMPSSPKEEVIIPTSDIIIFNLAVAFFWNLIVGGYNQVCRKMS